MLSLIGFLVAVGFGVLIPVLPVIAKQFGVNNFAVGAVVSALPVLRLVTGPFCGRITSWLDQRVTLGLGTAIVAVSSAGCGLATSYPQLLMFRSFGGIGSAMFTVAALTTLLGVTPAHSRGRASATYMGGFLIGSMAGPAVGAALTTISLRAPFFFYATTLLIASLVGVLVLKTKPVRPTQRTPQDTQAAPYTNVRYLLACATNFTTGWQSFGARTLLVPIFVTEVLHEPTTKTGVVFALAAVAQGLALGPVGRAVDAVGRKPLMITGLLICGVSSSAVAFSPNVVLLTVLLCVFGIGASMLSTAPTAVVGDITGDQGTPVAIFQMSMDLGSILGPMAAGGVSDAVSMPAAFGVGAILMLVVAVLVALLMRLGKSSHPSST